MEISNQKITFNQKKFVMNLYQYPCKMILQDVDYKANDSNTEYKKQWRTKHRVFRIKTTNMHNTPYHIVLNNRLTRRVCTRDIS
jgi:hypothetical protein